jgi:hypothetical protein
VGEVLTYNIDRQDLESQEKFKTALVTEQLVAELVLQSEHLTPCPSPYGDATPSHQLLLKINDLALCRAHKYNTKVFMIVIRKDYGY